jgi:hypothetical protein
MKTSELTGAALDWAVRECIERDDGMRSALRVFTARKIRNPSTDWSQGGPIIEREWDNLLRWFYLRAQKDAGDMWPDYMLNGKPVLQAFMQAFVASKLGDEIVVPKELL